MTPTVKGLLIGGGVIAATLAGLGIARAAQNSGASCQSWRPATNADVARDGTQGIYQALLSRPVGTTQTGTFNGRLWRFVVCQGGQCTPPSTFAKDVRGFICTG